MLEHASVSPATINLNHLPFDIDKGIGARANIGLVVLASDQTIEYEYRRIMSMPGIAIYQSRIANSNAVTPENLKAMEPLITQITDLILPGMHMDVIGYGCTSASMVIGEERVMDLMRAARPDSLFTTPITAAQVAFEKLGMKRIALLTPYRDDINNYIRGYLEERGIYTPVMGSFNEEDDTRACRIQTGAIRDAAIQLGQRDEVDGVFVSCTSLRVAEIVSDIERAIDKPVTASNHAMAWHSLRLAGINDKIDGLGRLYQL